MFNCVHIVFLFFFKVSSLVVFLARAEAHISDEVARVRQCLDVGTETKIKEVGAESSFFVYIYIHISHVCFYV